jgi:RNA polymerase sigma-70 factor (ECF subfamily)
MDDEEARRRFTAMYDAHRNQVWAYAAWMADRQSADDLVSETFVVAWRRLRDIPEPALPWLLGVARNLVRELSRAQRRRGLLESELGKWSARAVTVNPDETVATRIDVLRALAALGEQDREVLILTAWHELTPHEAALVLGVAPTAIRVRLHRARKRLRLGIDTARWQSANGNAPAPAGRQLAREGLRNER